MNSSDEVPLKLTEMRQMPVFVVAAEGIDTVAEVFPESAEKIRLFGSSGTESFGPLVETANRLSVTL